MKKKPFKHKRKGIFAIIARADGKYQVQNTRTGTRTRPYTYARCERILKPLPG